MFETRCTMNHALIGWAPTVFYRIDTKHAMMSQNKKTFSVRGARTTDVLIQQNGGWGGGVVGEMLVFWKLLYSM